MEIETNEEVEVQAWRLTCLERAGCPHMLALRIALDPEVDLHQALDLLAQGCTAELVVDILT